MRLSLSLLGAFQASLDGRPITDFYSKKVRALLAYLAVEAGRRHTRPVLAALLWPDWADRAALGNLRFSLSKLRQAIGDQYADPPFLLISRDAVQFNPSGECSVDVHLFEQELAVGRWQAAAADGQPESAALSAIGHLETAAGLYRGSFLEGFTVGDSAAFEEWALLERQQLEQEMRSALHGLAALYYRLGDYAAVERYARRLLEMDPWDEPANRRLMSALANMGDRNAALRHYAVLRQELAKELGAEPTGETTTLYRQIKEGSDGRGGTPPPGRGRPVPAPALARNLSSTEAGRLDSPDPSLPSAPLSPRHRRLVAREPQLAQLNAYLAQALAGQGCIAFVSGEAGSGKTTLITGFARQAMRQHDDLLAASGRCNVYTGLGDPYLPFREIAALLAGDVEARCATGEMSSEGARRLQAAGPAVAAALIETAPDLADRFVPTRRLAPFVATPTAGTRASPPAARQSGLHELMRHRATDTAGLEQPDLFSQLTAFLCALARTQPLLLLLDDLQWADRGSLSLLFHLGRRLAGARILIIGTYRPEELLPCQDGIRHPLLAAVNELRRIHGGAEVDLSQANGRRFVEDFLDREANCLGAAFRETLFQHTGGHPLFTIELLHGMQERGELALDSTGAWVEASILDWNSLPPRVEAVIAERVGRLPSDAQKLLAAASVEGETFTAEVVAQALGLHAAEVRRELSEVLGQRHRIVRGCRVEWAVSGRQPLSRYRFQHFLFHEYLYERLDPVERNRLHGLIGEALEQLYGANAADVAVQLAWHFERAGLMARAAKHLLVAGNQATRLAAYREAAAYFERGLALLSTLPETPERRLAELDLRLALTGPLVALHRMTDAIRTESVTPIVPLGRHVGGKQAIYALAVEASACRDRGDFSRAFELGEQMLALAQANGDRQSAMLAHFVLGTTGAFGGGVDQARAGLEAALGLYCDAEDQGLVALVGMDPRAMTLGALALILWMQGYPDQAESRVKEALELAQAAAQPPSLAVVLVFSIWLGHLKQAFQDLRPYIQILRKAVDENGLEIVRRHAQVYSGWLVVQQGQIAEGVKAMRDALAAGDPIPGDPGLLAILAQTCLDAGLYDEGLAAIDAGLAMVKTGIGLLMEADLHRLRGDLLLKQAAASSQAGATTAAAVEAEPCYLKAIEIARRRGARSWELRAAIGLARLWQQDKPDEARRMLAQVYESFGEGFDTRDLQAARALIAALE